MNIVLNAEWERFVTDQVNTGRFTSAQAVVETALARLMQEDPVADFEPGELDKLLAEGEADIERGDVLSMEEVREHFRQREREAANRKQSQPSK